MVNKLIAQGAEAKLFRKDNTLLKERVKKSYRVEELDNKIRKLRTRKERKLLEKAASLIPVPKVLDSCDEKMTIKMEFIDGEKLSEYLDKYEEKKRTDVCKLIGKQVAILHNHDIIHGDLTTSNMILKDKKLYFIDFGLGFESKKDEDQAVDLHVLKQALESKHYKHYESSFKAVLDGYKEIINKDIMKRFDEVERRGRYKEKAI